MFIFADFYLYMYRPLGYTKRTLRKPPRRRPEYPIYPWGTRIVKTCTNFHQLQWYQER